MRRLVYSIITAGFYATICSESDAIRYKILIFWINNFRNELIIFRKLRSFFLKKCLLNIKNCDNVTWGSSFCYRKWSIANVRVSMKSRLPKCRNLRSWFNKKIIEHPIRFTLIISLLLFLGAYIFLLILSLIDNMFKDCTCIIFTRFEGGVESWFSFYGSFFGVIATVIVGIITLRLDIKMNQIQIASEVNKLTLKKIHLYDRKREFKPSIWANGDDSKRFMLELIFSRFEPYYSIEINQVLWGIFDPSFDVLKQYKLDIQVAKVQTPDKLKVYISFDDIKVNDRNNTEHSFNYFYCIQRFEPILMPAYEKQRQLILKLQLENTLYPLKKDKMFVDFKVKVEHGGIQKGYVLFIERDCQLNIDTVF